MDELKRISLEDEILKILSEHFSFSFFEIKEAFSFCNSIDKLIDALEKAEENNTTPVTEVNRKSTA